MNLAVNLGMIMKRAFWLMAIFLFSIVDNTSAFTCGQKFVSKGDPSFLILSRCGEPISRELIGYTLTPDQRIEKVIERWVYGPINGWYKVLTIEGGILVKEESIIAR